MKLNNYTLSYTIADTIVGGIMTVLVFLLFILCILFGEISWWISVLIGVGCLWSAIETLRCFIVEFKITFNHNGFTVNEHNRLTSNDRIRQYIWKEIRELYFMGRFSPRGLPRLLVFYKAGGWDEIGFRYTIKICEFVKLARQYSGRENIIRNYKQRKPFEKDW